MATNILAIPKAHAVIQTGTNEDWLDCIEYVVGTDPGGPQLDLRGIAFEMELRRRPPDHEVILHASTADGSISVGASPNFGYLIFYVKEAVMEQREADLYVGEVRASDGQYQRIILTMEVEIIQGVTR
jgi:hypothetical protein